MDTAANQTREKSATSNVSSSPQPIPVTHQRGLPSTRCVARHPMRTQAASGLLGSDEATFMTELGFPDSLWALRSALCPAAAYGRDVRFIAVDGQCPSGPTCACSRVTAGALMPMLHVLLSGASVRRFAITDVLRPASRAGICSQQVASLHRGPARDKNHGSQFVFGSSGLCLVVSAVGLSYLGCDPQKPQTRHSTRSEFPAA